MGIVQARPPIHRIIQSLDRKAGQRAMTTSIRWPRAHGVHRDTDALQKMPFRRQVGGTMPVAGEHRITTNHHTGACTSWRYPIDSGDCNSGITMRVAAKVSFYLTIGAFPEYFPVTYLRLLRKTGICRKISDLTADGPAIRVGTQCPRTHGSIWEDRK